MEKIVFLFLVFSLNVFAHQGVDHSNAKTKEIIAEKNQLQTDATTGYENQLKLINESYLKNISDIFSKKCMDCHGEPKKMPWYHSLPVAKQIMNDDMKEAKKHLNIQDGFPFKGHGTPKQDLEAIDKAIAKGEMPPLRYKLMHWSSKISTNEAQIIKNWVEESLQLLDEVPQ